MMYICCIPQDSFLASFLINKMCSWHNICSARIMWSVRSMHNQHVIVSSKKHVYPQCIVRQYLWQGVLYVHIPWTPFILLKQTRLDVHFDLYIFEGHRWVHQEVHFYLSSNIGSLEESWGVSGIMGSPGLCTQYRQRVSNHGQRQDVERIYNWPVILPTVCHAAEGGFYGFLSTIPAGVRMLILEDGQVSDNFAEILNRQRMGKVVDSETRLAHQLRSEYVTMTGGFKIYSFTRKPYLHGYRILLVHGFCFKSSEH